MGVNLPIGLVVTASKSNEKVVAIFHRDKSITVSKVIFNTIF